MAFKRNNCFVCVLTPNASINTKWTQEKKKQRETNTTITSKLVLKLWVKAGINLANVGEATMIPALASKWSLCGRGKISSCRNSANRKAPDSTRM